MPSPPSSRPTRRRWSSSSTGSTCGCRSSRASSCSATAASSPTELRRPCSAARGRRSPRAGCGCPASRPPIRPRRQRHPERVLLSADRPRGAARGRASGRVGHRSRGSRRRRARDHRTQRRGQVDARPDARGTAAAGIRHPRRVAPNSRATRVARRSAGRRAQLLTRIGTVFQDPEHQLLAKTVRERARGRARARCGSARTRPARRVDELLERLRLAPLAAREPVHAVGRREAPAHGRGRPRDRAAGAGARRADVRAGCAHLGGARRACSRACATTAPRSSRSRTTSTSSRRSTPSVALDARERRR